MLLIGWGSGITKTKSCFEVFGLKKYGQAYDSFPEENQIQVRLPFPPGAKALALGQWLLDQKWLESYQHASGLKAQRIYVG